MTGPADQPMFRQYLDLKARHPDAFLFFRVGDFYEMFFDDAREAAEILEITLTTRNRNDPDPIPMCGVPRWSMESYLRRMVDAGHKVAIAEQMEDPRGAKGLVERQVVRVVSPGVVLDPEGLEAREPNYLVGLVNSRKGRWGIAFLDVSTGDLRVTETDDLDVACTEIARMGPREALLPEDLHDQEAIQAALVECLVNRHPRDSFSATAGRDVLLDVLGVADLGGYGASGLEPALGAAGALVRYARENSRSDLRHVSRLRVYHPSGHMILDTATRRNLEIDRSLHGGSRKGTLLGHLDRTATPMGGRLLREWLGFPLLDPGAIRTRLDAVECLADETPARTDLRERLKEVADLERIGSKLVQKTAQARDLSGLRQSLGALPGVMACARTLPPLAPFLPEDLASDVYEEIDRWLLDEPSSNLTEGGLIREGVHADLDDLVRLSRAGEGAIEEMEAREREATGIGSLKIRSHKTQGFFIEITRANLARVPSHYRRWQTLSNVERYITPELKEFEDKVLTADTRRKNLEYQLFCDLRDRVAAQIPRIQTVAMRIAELDVLSTLAELAVRHRYVRPSVHTDEDLDLEDARHPVVETTLRHERFVPNSIRLDPEQRRMVVLTGPNMAGKSTIMRQVALIALLAQIGSFVPARRARIGICDRIFVRVGASDDLTRGRSTFMVEMAETSNILHNASRRSLVLLDEIGRGTSTYDGLSIAWAVAEAIHDRIRCRAIFATHYHELVGFARTHPRAANMRVAVSQMGERIIFLRRLQEGATSRSYGIQCAQLAGMPREVLDRARQFLRELERQRPQDDRQLSLFDLEPDTAGLGTEDLREPPAGTGGSDILRDALRAIDPDSLSPKDALAALYRLRAMV